jgi:hypothetical protein
MSKPTNVVRVDSKTYTVLKNISLKTDVPMGRIVKRHILGKPCKIKKVGEY